MDSIWNEIKKIADENSGFIKTNAVEAAGISRLMLRKYVEEGRGGTDSQSNSKVFKDTKDNRKVDSLRL